MRDPFKSITSFFFGERGSVRASLASLRRKVGFREHMTEILLMIPSLGTMMLTYYGISVTMEETGATLVQKGQALAFSLCIGVFAWLGWFFAFGLIYHLRGRRLASALSALVVFVGTLAAIDAPFNMMALSGGTAVQMSLADTTSAYEEKKDGIFERATVAQRLVPGIKAQAARFRQLEADEIAHGVYSGRKGPGKVSAGFGQIATLLDALVAELEIGLDEARAVQEEIAKAFGELKAQTFRQGPIRPRVEAATVAADRIDDLLGRLGQYDYSTSIGATLASLENIFPAPTVAGSTFERTQNAELAVIAEMARPVADALGTGLETLQGLPSAAPAKVRPLSVHVAIRTYWQPLLAEWAAAMFIDIAPAILLIILIAAWREHDVGIEAGAAPGTGVSPNDPPDDDDAAAGSEASAASPIRIVRTA
jgi:hypothetical protein